MERTGSVGTAAAVASLFAGPLFLTTTAAAGFYLELPKPVIITGPQLMAFLIWLIPATLVGMIIAFPLNVIGSAWMVAMADSTEAARIPAVWALAGAGIGAAIGSLFWPNYELSFALASTAAICATICRSYVDWE